MVMPSSSDDGFLLTIPTELRLEIYKYCLAEPTAITITAAQVTTSSKKTPDVSRREIPGLPREYNPLVRSYYDPSLLSLAESPYANFPNGATDLQSKCDQLPYPTSLALLQSCRLINSELRGEREKWNFDKLMGGLSLFVTYPFGVLILKEVYPQLLQQAKNVYISGYYYKSPKPEQTEETEHGIMGEAKVFRFARVGFNSSRASRLDTNFTRKIAAFPTDTAIHAPKVLCQLICTIFAPKPGSIQKLEARFLYPGESYSSIWSDDKGPVASIFGNICGGNIDTEVARGRHGNAIYLVAKPDPNRRAVRTSWAQLGNTFDEAAGSVIGPHWPEV
ncbi:hypothetical protein B0J11DRAFT_583312 [Dendryphion nanum]|uniref:Uncharacterized protein n=1 Tax=Dendryphion nanum TaxID=256645 RepID=A0A9P9IFY0_9PLEO|nr:hypothetical protein B0J11DRAFT_583312 [Dendryphion nanum]